LPKADIFALGLTLHELMGGGSPPKNGPTWHSLRAGELPRLSNCSNDFNQLLKVSKWFRWPSSHVSQSSSHVSHAICFQTTGI